MTHEESRRLLDAARGVRIVSSRGHAVGRKRLLSAIAAGTVTAKALSAEASLAGSTLGVGGTATTIAGSLLGLAGSAIAVGIATGTLLLSPGTEPVATTQKAPASVSTSALKPQTDPGSTPRILSEHIAPLEPTIVAPIAERVEVAPISPNKRERPSIEEETQLLQRAQGAFRRGLYDDALQLLLVHEKTFPQARLGEEAAALRVLVYCQLGRIGDAKRWARFFVENYTSSALWNRLKASCPQVLDVAPEVPRE